MSDRRHHLDTSGGTNPSRRFWRLPLMLALLVVVILVAKIFGPNQVVVHPNEPQAPPSLPSASGKTVSLAIQTADGAVRHDYLPWFEGMTVEDLLTAASHLPKGIQFTEKGSGESALLTEIDGTVNEGTSGRNWTYSVNDQEADRSCAVFKLQPGDKVLWIFSEKQ